jgi:hypothetical protein
LEDDETKNRIGEKLTSRVCCGTSSLDLVQLSIIAVAMEDSGELHDLGLLIDGIHDAIFTLGDPKAGEAPVGEMRELLRIRRTRRAAET